jgi:hypothetical protein
MEEDLILNFYGWPGPTPDAIATAFARPRSDFRVIFGYGAPDDLTGAKAFFVVSQQFYSGETYGYVNISKISSVGSGTHTATLEENQRALLLTADPLNGRSVWRAKSPNIPHRGLTEETAVFAIKLDYCGDSIPIYLVTRSEIGPPRYREMSEWLQWVSVTVSQ